MTRLVRAELFKLRTTHAWWILTLATVVSTAATLVVNCIQAHTLLQSFSQYVVLQTHDHADKPPADFIAQMRSEWILGHNAVTQAATIYTSGQLIGLLLAALLGIVVVTSEYYQQTATSTFLITPRRSTVIAGKLMTAIVIAAGAWLVSTLISVVTGLVFLHGQGYSSQLTHWGVDRAIVLNLAAYVIWAVFGVGFGALVRNQLGATVGATVLYLVGAAAASSVFDLLHTYVIANAWILSAQVIVPPIASTVMISPTQTFLHSPPQWVGAGVLLGYGLLLGLLGVRSITRRDVT